MTVQQDLQKSLAAAQAAQGTYLVFAQATQDQQAQQMYQSMADDMARHARDLQGRLKYLAAATAPMEAAAELAPAPGKAPKPRHRQKKRR